ncbi:hypothetical protein JZ785_02115 [Alicyclobacillus curvatus]|jgi:hypothetical protein|nr:hypothetical protein JZ785_02115 [Alicyclobacillus curvatus]
MRVREHFLLGTDQATISVTARGTQDRETLFIHALNAILEKYKEEFGPEHAAKAADDLRTAVESDTASTTTNWRLRDEDSCWTEAKRQLAQTDHEV